MFNTITYEDFEKDITFNHYCNDKLDYDTHAKILGYVTDTDMSVKKLLWNSLPFGQALGTYDFVLVHVIGIVEKIVSVHPDIKEDLDWILHQRLKEWARMVDAGDCDESLPEIADRVLERFRNAWYTEK